MSKFYCGFVAIVGQTNAGKSTLINQLIKEKVAIVSPKPQTSRNNTLGIFNDENSQIIFIDTPGHHKISNKIDEYMYQNIGQASTDADVLLFVIDGKKPLLEQYEVLNNKYKKHNKPKILVVNKIDDTTFERLYPKLDILTKNSEIKEILPLSALRGTNCDILISNIKEVLPAYDSKMQFYPTEQFTDKSEKFLCAEIIREKALYLYDEEIPHGLAVVINSFVENEKLTKISADIICEKESHKKILLGQNGDKIKKLSSTSRIEIEKLLGKKVYLEIFVKVRDSWRLNENLLKDLGYQIQE